MDKIPEIVRATVGPGLNDGDGEYVGGRGIWGGWNRFRARAGR